MELPTEFPSVEDSLDDSDADLQPIQFSLDEEPSSSPRAVHPLLCTESLVPAPPAASVQYSAPPVLPAASEPVPPPALPLQQERDRLHLAALQAALASQVIPASPSQISAQMLQSDVQLAGLESLDQLNLDGLLRRLSSKDGHQREAAARYLDLPAPDALFADLDRLQSAGSRHWEAESIEPLYRSSNESEEVAERGHSHAAPKPGHVNGQPSLQSAPLGFRQDPLWQSADLPTVFVDVRAGHETAHEEAEEEEVDIEVMSSASEGELASMAAEVAGWRQQRARLKRLSEPGHTA